MGKMLPLWNMVHEGQQDPVLDEGIYEFTVKRIVSLDENKSITLAFDVNGRGIAACIPFDKEPYTVARCLLASVGILKDFKSQWATSELANTVGRKGRGLIDKYIADNGEEKNRFIAYIVPWADEDDFLWKYRVMKRANWKCEACGAHGTVAHHKKPKSVYPDEMYDVKNGQCLCEPCHNAWHDMYGTMAVGGPGL